MVRSHRHFEASVGMPVSRAGFKLPCVAGNLSRFDDLSLLATIPGSAHAGDCRRSKQVHKGRVWREMPPQRESARDEFAQPELDVASADRHTHPGQLAVEFP